MKRLFSFMMVLVMILSLSVTAFADEQTPADGTITVKNATIDQKYRLFKIFDARPNDSNPPKVAYTIKSGDTFYDAMFGTDGLDANDDGTLDAYDVFNYTESTGVITLKEGMTETQVSAYLTKLIAEFVDKTSAVQPIKTVTAAAQQLVFTDLEPGYYLIDRGIASTVTIDTNTPAVTVIDKNQEPGTGFDKLVWDADAPVYDAEGKPTGEKGCWVVQNSASVGDVLEWDISFEATNYDGKELVQYYSVSDHKDSPLWVEFNDIEVYIMTKDENGDDVQTFLEKGYYFYAGNPDLNTNEWTLFGDGWSKEQKDAAKAEISGENGVNSVRTLYKDEANWYLVHYGYDEFEIVIPWLKNHTFTGIPGKSDSEAYKGGYQIAPKRDANNNIIADHRYDPTVTVHITYTASVGPEASLKGAVNTANLFWTTVTGSKTPNDPQTTTTNVYNMSVTKVADDGTNSREATRLAGAVFELYRDSACTKPVYVIPTNETGVYVVDDIFNTLSGHKRVSSRDKYSIINKVDGKEINTGKWVAYLAETYEDENGVEQRYAEAVTVGANTEYVRRDMITQDLPGDNPEDGRLIILGLEAGTYYLKETVPPEGYNQLAAPVAVKVAIEGAEAAEVMIEGNKRIVYMTQVINSQGVELPSTGGKGTMMMIAFGSSVAMLFAVLMITQKKMSIYKD